MTDPTYERDLRCAFESVHEEFSKHIGTARSKLSRESLDEYYDGVEFFATIGQETAFRSPLLMLCLG
jgi:hypothetical protein